MAVLKSLVGVTGGSCEAFSCFVISSDVTRLSCEAVFSEGSTIEIVRFTGLTNKGCFLSSLEEPFEFGADGVNAADAGLSLDSGVVLNLDGVRFFSAGPF